VGGKVWFTATGDNAYGWHDPETGQHKVFHWQIKQPYGITGTKDQVWIASYDGSDLYAVVIDRDGTRLERRIDVSEPAVAGRYLEGAPREVRRKYAKDWRVAGIRRLASDGYGRIWTTELHSGRISEWNTRLGSITRIQNVLQPSRPYGIAYDEQGILWVFEQSTNVLTAVRYVGLERDAVHRFPIGRGTARGIAVDRSGRRVWLTISEEGALIAVDFPLED
jgi:streptogramin lyase